MSITQDARIAQAGPRDHRWLPRVVALLLSGSAACAAAAPQDRILFTEAWEAASRGDHAVLEQRLPQLRDYLLTPYLRYETLREQRAHADPAEMRDFLDAHSDWAFARPLRAAWLRSLGRAGRWRSLLENAEGALDVETRCYLARAHIELKQTEGLVPEVQSLWTVGKSQPRACDRAFAWLDEQGGITTELAWERIRLAMRAGNPGLARYLGRFLPAGQRPWLDRWRDLDRGRYHRLPRARGWPDEALPRTIAATSLLRLARLDAERALAEFALLDAHFDWSDAVRGEVMRELALEAAVDLSEKAMPFLAQVPVTYRDAQLLEWWARAAIAHEQWKQLADVIEAMPPETQEDGRWRYWRAVALGALGQTAPSRSQLQSLAAEATFHGFLAADAMGLPYTICPRQPDVAPATIEQLRSRPGFARALELRAVGLENWAGAEWQGAVNRLMPAELTVAAALARQEGWHDRAIFALGNGGHLRWYEWRFPVLWDEPVARESARLGLDRSWVLGVMRSESALDEQARSSAGALGLMQVTPATARRTARAHGLSYRGAAQLLEAEQNIRFGTAVMRDLLDRFGENPVLAAGAYNAGPEAVERWLDERPRTSAAAWIETIPYYETRDYIPRVLAFTAIYDWRLGQPVTRVSSRMPAIDSGKMSVPETVEVVCQASG